MFVQPFHQDDNNRLRNSFPFSFLSKNTKYVQYTNMWIEYQFPFSSLNRKWLLVLDLDLVCWKYCLGTASIRLRFLLSILLLLLLYLKDYCLVTSEILLNSFLLCHWMYPGSRHKKTPQNSSLYLCDNAVKLSSLHFERISFALPYESVWKILIN